MLGRSEVKQAHKQKTDIFVSTALEHDFELVDKTLLPGSGYRGSFPLGAMHGWS